MSVISLISFFVFWALIHSGLCFSFTHQTAIKLNRSSRQVLTKELCPVENAVLIHHHDSNVGCSIPIKTLDPAYPLIVNPNNPKQFLKPNEATGIYLAMYEVVRLACPGNENFINTTQEKHQFQNFICASDGTMVDCDNEDHSYKIEDFRCQKEPSSTVKETKTTDESLREGEKKLEIGFETSKNDFLPIIEIYQDSNSLSTYYAKSEVWHTLNLKPKFIFHRQNFESEFYHQYLDLAMIYDGKRQTTYFNQMLGYSSDWIRQSDYAKYCKRLDSSFLNRGHLTPKGSLLYPAAAKATFKYINVQPQWKAINNEMWSSIETFVSQLAESLQKDFTVYTGVHGQAQLKTIKGEVVPLFLTSDKEIPVPLYFYKIIVDEESNKGIVYVTVNTPFCKVVEVEPLCKDVNPGPTNMRRPVNWGSKSCKFECGYSYWCRVDDFLQTSGVVVHGLKSSLELLYDEKS